MDTRDFYVCLDARPSNISLLRRLANDHLRTAGIARSTAQKTQTTVVRAFAEAVERSLPQREGADRGRDPPRPRHQRRRVRAQVALGAPGSGGRAAPRGPRFVRARPAWARSRPIRGRSSARRVAGASRPRSDSSNDGASVAGSASARRGRYRSPRPARGIGRAIVSRYKAHYNTERGLASTPPLRTLTQGAAPLFRVRSNRLIDPADHGADDPTHQSRRRIERLSRPGQRETASPSPSSRGRAWPASRWFRSPRLGTPRLGNAIPDVLYGLNYRPPKLAERAPARTPLTPPSRSARLI